MGGGNGAESETLPEEQLRRKRKTPSIEQGRGASKENQKAKFWVKI